MTDAERFVEIARGDNSLLSLMDACPYIWEKKDGREKFAWQNGKNATELFCAKAENIPESLNGFLARICDEGVSARKRVFKSLNWNGAKFKIDYQIRTFNGRNIWVEERGVRLNGDSKNPTKILGVLTNIQNRKTREEQAGYHASFDSLTGMWNALRMREGLTHMLGFSRRYDRQSAYIVFRVTNLKDINATYDYGAGDRLLHAIAKRLTNGMRSPDISARVDGSSFGLGMFDCDGAQMEMIAARIGKILNGSPYGSPYGDLYAEFAVGGCALSQKSVSATDAMEQVYTALSHSENRQGAFVAFSESLPDLKPRQSIKDLTRDDIIRALNERRITLAFQPIVCAKTRDIHHYECLLRLRKDDGEMVSAAEFIMAAERLECVHLLDRRALEIAGRALQEHNHIQLALNVSAATVQNTDTANAYLAAVRALGKDTGRVIIEMTETVALDDPAMASRFSVEARAMECRFAIDDFGAGYTTFKNLMAIKADEIKIDGSFIRDLSLTPHKQMFVRMIVDFAQTFSVKTVAEMVGSREDANLLTNLGVDYLQGYMFGLPSPVPLSTNMGSMRKTTAK